MKKHPGYIMIMLLLILTIMSIGLMVAVPVWETQIQREKEEELIFRGKQYVEAVRLFQVKNPGSFPKTLAELVEEKCLRRLYKDPMTPEGEWKVILQPEGPGLARPSGQLGVPPPPRDPKSPDRGQGFSVQQVHIVPLNALASIRNARVLGVVSASTKKSIKIYNEQESYDKWLFFYGQVAGKLPEITYYGETSKSK